MALKDQSTSKSTFKNAQNGQTGYQKAFEDVNTQILHSTLIQLLNVIPKMGENGL